MNDGSRKATAKALVPFGELVMFMPMEKSKDKGGVWNRVGIMFLRTDLTESMLARLIDGSVMEPREYKARRFYIRQGSGADEVRILR